MSPYRTGRHSLSMTRFLRTVAYRPPLTDRCFCTILGETLTSVRELLTNFQTKNQRFYNCWLESYPNHLYSLMFRMNCGGYFYPTSIDWEWLDPLIQSLIRNFPGLMEDCWCCWQHIVSHCVIDNRSFDIDFSNDDFTSWILRSTLPCMWWPPTGHTSKSTATSRCSWCLMS